MIITVEIQARSDKSGLPCLWMIVSDANGCEILSQPYAGAMPIDSLFTSCSGAPDKKKQELEFESENFVAEDPREKRERPPARAIAEVSENINRRDTVRFIGDVDKDSPAELIKNHEYRVLGVTKQNGRTVSYDLIDDASKNKIRLTVPADSVTLIKKAGPKEKKKVALKELVHTCEDCDEEIVLIENGKRSFAGQCGNCQKNITVKT